MDVIFGYLNQSIISVAGWFTTLFTKSGVASLYLSMIFIALVGKFILSPLFGSSRGSDKAKKKRSGSDG